MIYIDRNTLASMIDHTLLKPDATQEKILQLCKEADVNHFASVCVNSCYTKAAARALKDSKVKICTVIGFPLGASSTAAKVSEANTAVQDGANEIDMVINIGALKSGQTNLVEDEIRQVRSASGTALLKVIIETCYLTESEKIIACQLAAAAGAHFVKTSTGFGTAGATLEDVALMRKTVGTGIGVKASGGIRSLEDAVNMINSGANRLGVSMSVSILEELDEIYEQDELDEPYKPNQLYDRG